MNRFAITYHLDGSGWAKARVQLGGSTLECDISYLPNDALDDLSGALIELIMAAGEDCVEVNMDTGTETIRPDNRRSVVWPGEPWAYVWDLEFEPPDTLNVVVTFHETYPDTDECANHHSLKGSCSFHQFAAAIVAALESLLVSEGLVSYRTKWMGHEFPMSRLLLLKRFVAEFTGQAISQELKQKLAASNWKLDREYLSIIGPHKSA